MNEQADITKTYRPGQGLNTIWYKNTRNERQIDLARNTCMKPEPLPLGTCPAAKAAAGAKIPKFVDQK